MGQITEFYRRWARGLFAGAWTKAQGAAGVLAILLAAAPKFPSLDGGMIEAAQTSPWLWAIPLFLLVIWRLIGAPYRMHKEDRLAWEAERASTTETWQAEVARLEADEMIRRYERNWDRRPANYAPTIGAAVLALRAQNMSPKGLAEAKLRQQEDYITWLAPMLAAGLVGEIQARANPKMQEILAENGG